MLALAEVGARLKRGSQAREQARELVPWQSAQPCLLASL